MLSVKKLEDTVQCKWSIDYKGFLKCALKRNEQRFFEMCMEKERKCRGCSERGARGKPLWIFVPFQRTLQKNFAKIIMLTVFIYTACKSCKGG